MAVDKIKLWEEYQKTPTPKLREELIIEYAGLVKLVAGKLTMYLGSNVEYDDLVGYGVFGLIDAIDKFDLGKGVKFETYASLRIKGAILDQIRKMDWIPRTIRQKQKKIDEAVKNIENITGKSATDKQVADELGLSDEEYIQWQGQLKVTNLISLNEFMEQGGEPVSDTSLSSSHFEMPETKVARDELKEVLAQSLEILTEKEKKVVLMYYYEELTLKEISEVLEVSESRISQLHTKALSKMKKKMGQYMGIMVG